MTYEGAHGHYEVRGGECFLSRHRSGLLRVGKHQLIALLEREPRSIPLEAWEQLKATLVAAYAIS